MRGSDQRNGTLFSYVCVEDRVPQNHPLRTILKIVNAALARLDGDFAALYASEGRPSIAPERLLRATLIQILFSIRSERQLMEQLDYNLLFRWFVGLDIDDSVWVPTVFTKNRDRLLNADIARKFMAAILADEAIRPLLSEEHFSVDGTLIEAWASMKSFQPKDTDDHASDDEDGCSGNTVRTCDDGVQPLRDRNAEVDFRGQKRSNETHVSMSDAQARLTRKGKGKPAQLCFMGHALMENRTGLIVETEVTKADGYAEREAALTMIHRHVPGSTRRLTLGADKGYDSRDFVTQLRTMCVTPHLAQTARSSAIDARTTRHLGYGISQRKRKQIEEPFGYGKTVGPLARRCCVASLG